MHSQELDVTKLCLLVEVVSWHLVVLFPYLECKFPPRLWSSQRETSHLRLVEDRAPPLPSLAYTGVTVCCDTAAFTQGDHPSQKSDPDKALHTGQLLQPLLGCRLPYADLARTRTDLVTIIYINQISSSYLFLVTKDSCDRFCFDH